MRATSKLLALVLAAALQPAFADVVLKFNDITPATEQGSGAVQILDRYLSSDGVQFKNSAWGVASYKCVTDPDNETGFSFNAVDDGCGAVLLASGGDAEPTFTINYADGFVSGSSFLYSALRGSNVIVKVFDELDGKGDFTTFTNLTTSVCNVDGVIFCDWTKLLLSFSGTAYSIVVSGVDESFMIDNLSLLAAGSNPNPTPEPASIALALGALGALGWTRRRRAR